MELGDQREPVEVLAEEFAQQNRRGETVSIEDFAKQNPQHADQIRRLFPMLLAMEEAGIDTSSLDFATRDTDQSEAPIRSDIDRTYLPRDAGSEDHVRQIYARRTSILASVGALIYFFGTVMVWFDWSPALPADELGMIGLVPLIVCGFALATQALINHYNHQMSLRSLRRIETCVLLTVGVSISILQIRIMNIEPATGFEGPLHAQSHVGFLNFGRSFEWFIIIVSYGLFIPNPWRRTAAVSLLCSGLSVAVALIAAQSNENVAENLSYVLMWTVFSVFPASVIATFGSFKIDSLQREVFEAKRLGPYQLQEKIGVGGMGEVYLAQHHLLKRPCAIKLIRSDRERVAGSMERFEREVQITSALTHPNTVDVFDYGRTPDGTFYYVMEYLDGPNLDDLVREQGPIASARTVHLIRQLCGALSEAHDLGIVHRDIKPSNVILCKQGGVYDVAKLVDFGLVTQALESTVDSKITQLGTAIGTPQFMSPEQARGDENIDVRSDLYSLGAVAYFLLTGRPPIEGRSVLDTIASVVTQPPKPISASTLDVPADLDRVVMRCLEKDPNARFSDVRQLLAEIDHCQLQNIWTEKEAASWWSENRMG